MKKSRRFLALVLCMLMCVSMFPAQVFAEETNSADFGDSEEIIGAESASTEPETPAEEPSDEAGDSSALPDQPADPAEQPAENEAVTEAEIEEETVSNDAAMAPANSCGDGLTWELNDGILTISYTGAGTGSMTDWTYDGADSPWCADTTIKSVVIGEGVTHIGNWAFLKCTGIKYIEFPATTLKTIGDGAFSYCSNLTDYITIPDGVTSIGESAFSFSGLQSVTLADSVKNISGYAFYCCRNLTDVFINGTSELETIGKFAFYYCGLLYINIPASVTSIGDAAFAANEEISGFHVSQNNSSYCVVDGVLFSKDLTTLVAYPAGAGDTTYTVPDTVTSLAEFAFSSSRNLASVALPAGVTRIDSDYLFYGCSNLTSVSLSANLENIGNFMFEHCDNLTNIIIPESVTDIGAYAFYDTGITAVEIPKSVTSLSYGAFGSCLSLKNIYFYGSAPQFVGDNIFADGDELNAYYISGASNWTDDVLQDYGGKVTWASNGMPGASLFWRLDEDGTLTVFGKGAMPEWSSPYKEVPWYDKKDQIKNVVISEDVTSVGNGAFSECTNLTFVALPSTLETIGDRAFTGCKNLQGYSLDLGLSSLTSIGTAAFYECTNLFLNSDFYIPASVVSIGKRAFYQCGMNRIVVPKASELTSIGENAFYGCTELNFLELYGGRISIDDYAFDGCTNLNNVTFNGGVVTSIGNYAFSKCERLGLMEIPDGLESIGEYAFSNSGLDHIKIPTSVTSIGEYAFANCTWLNSIIFYGDHPTFGDNVFNNDTNVTAYYPIGYDWPESVRQDYGGDVKWEAYLHYFKLTGVSNVANGVKITWDKVTGADYYEVWRSVWDEDASKWNSSVKYATITDATVTDYVDENAASGKQYTYYVKAYTAAEDSSTSNELSIMYLAVPQRTGISNTTNGVEIDWYSVNGAKSYNVYRKSGDGQFEPLGHTTDTAYVDSTAESGTQYTYTFTAVNSNYESFLDESNTLTILSLAAPELKSARNATNGVTLTWTAVAGAASYKVYRKVLDATTGEWSANWGYPSVTDDCTYTDENADSGTEYQYAVTAYDQFTDSAYSNAVNIVRLATPALGAVSNLSTGVKITWTAVTGATTYKVYRQELKASTGEWSVTWDYQGPTSNLTYTDTYVSSGTEYRYSVSACAAGTEASYESAFGETSLSILYLAAPVLKSIRNTDSGVKLTWTAVAGADCYAVYKRIGTKLSSLYTTKDCEYTDTSLLVSGSEYEYAVKACYSGTKTYSAYSNHLSITYTPVPTLESISNEKNDIKITWKAFSGATSYTVMRQIWDASEGTWSRLTPIGIVTDCTYTDPDQEISAGTEYRYTVKADNSTTYDELGLSIIRLKAPADGSVSNAANGIKIAWSAVTGAEGYQVLRKTDGMSDWEPVATTSNLYCYDLYTSSGTKYQYTVVAYATDYEDNETTYVSANIETDLSILRLAAPKPEKISNTVNGVLISWKAVSAADSYIISRSVWNTESGEWGALVDSEPTSACTYTDDVSNLISGTKYLYAIKAYDADTETYSALSHEMTIMYLAAPELYIAKNLKDGVQVTWTPVTGAESYNVYRKTDDGYKLIGDTTTTYVDETAESAHVYTYTVTAVNGEYESAWDESGESVLRLETPVLTEIRNTDSGVKLTWNAVPSAEYYLVFRKTSSDTAWYWLPSTRECTFTDTGEDYELVSGTTYYYMIVAYGAYEGTTYSSWDSNELSIAYELVPTLESIYNAADGVTITWKPFSGATSYNVYRKDFDASTGTWSDWNPLVGIASTTYTDEDVKAGNKYCYTVRPNTSTFRDETGLTITYYPAGDVNADGMVNLLDLLVLKQALANDTVAQLKTPNGADINHDGSVNLQDLLILKQTLAGVTA